MWYCLDCPSSFTEDEIIKNFGSFVKDTYEQFGNVFSVRSVELRDVCCENCGSDNVLEEDDIDPETLTFLIDKLKLEDSK